MLSLSVERIYKKHNELLRYATSITGCKHEAADVMQEVYIRLMRHKFDQNFDVEKYKPVLFTIIKQVIITQKRKDATYQKHIERQEPPQESNPTDRDLRQVLGEFLWSLPKFDRYLLYLRATKAYGTRKLEKYTGINRGTIQYSLWQSRKKAANLPLRKKQILKKALRKVPEML